MMSIMHPSLRIVIYDATLVDTQGFCVNQPQDTNVGLAVHISNKSMFSAFSAYYVRIGIKHSKFAVAFHETHTDRQRSRGKRLE